MVKLSKKIIIIVIGMFLLFLIFALNPLYVKSQDLGKDSEIGDEMVNEKICSGRLCTISLNPSAENVIYEDGEYKKIEDVKSLKDKGLFSVDFIEVDDEFDVEVIDFNYTSITVNLIIDEKHKDKEIPVRIWEKNKSYMDSDDKDFVKGKESYSKINESIISYDKKSIKYKEGKYKISDVKTYDFGIDNLLEFGFNSTTITLNGSNFSSGGIYTNTTLAYDNIKLNMFIPIGRYTDTTSPNSVDHLYALFIDGDYAYTTSYYDDEIVILNISDKSNPNAVGNYIANFSLPYSTSSPGDIFVSGNYTYFLARNYYSLAVINTTDKTNPTYISHYYDDTAPYSLYIPEGLAIDGDFAYAVSNFGYSLIVFNISNKSNMIPISQYSSKLGYFYGLLGASSLFYQDDYIYISNYRFDKIMIFDISNRSVVNPIGYYMDSYPPYSMDYSMSIVVSNNYSYVSSSYDHSFTILNVTKKNSVSPLSDYVDSSGINSINGARAISVDGDVAYVSSNTGSTIVMFNISSKFDPQPISYYHQGSQPYSSNGVYDLYAQDGVLYVGSYGDSEFSIFNVSGYVPLGTYESDVINMGELVIWHNLTWEEEELSQTGINMSFRTCNDVVCSGESWSAWQNASPIDLSGESNSQYVQYRTQLITSNYTKTPRLISVDITSEIADSDPPNITINYPLNLNNYSGISMDFNITINDSSLIDTCLITLNNGMINYTMSNVTDSFYNLTNSSMGSGNYLAYFYCNDSLGNLNNTEYVNFTMDSTPPSLIINSPIQNKNYIEQQNIEFNITASDNLLLDSMLYSLDGSVNTSFNYNITITHNYGQHNTIFCVNDSVNNLNCSSVDYIVSRYGGGSGGYYDQIREIIQQIIRRKGFRLRFKIHYYQGDMEIKPPSLFNVFDNSTYNRISFDIYGKNEGDYDVKNITLMNAYPSIFKNSMIPIDNEIVQGDDKLLFQSRKILVDELGDIDESIEFYVNIAGLVGQEDIVEDEESVKFRLGDFDVGDYLGVTEIILIIFINIILLILAVYIVYKYSKGS